MIIGLLVSEDLDYVIKHRVQDSSQTTDVTDYLPKSVDGSTDFLCIQVHFVDELEPIEVLAVVLTTGECP